MLWFNFKLLKIVKKTGMLFKYISCYGSTSVPSSNSIYVSNLNTSHVMVQLAVLMPFHTVVAFKYISCYGSTKITVSFTSKKEQFKYISCYGSTNVWETLQGFGYKFKYISCYGSTSTKVK